MGMELSRPEGAVRSVVELSSGRWVIGVLEAVATSKAVRRKVIYNIYAGKRVLAVELRAALLGELRVVCLIGAMDIVDSAQSSWNEDRGSE